MTPFEIADTLRACLVSAYEGTDYVPGEICHRPGTEVPFSLGLSQDECCSGLAWVRIAWIDPVTDPSSANDRDDNPCNQSGRMVVLELGAARCNPYGTPSAGPSCATWTALAQLMDNDATAMRKAVCCFASLPEVGMDQAVYRVRGGRWEPIESSGACAGGTMQVVVWTDCTDC